MNTDDGKWCHSTMPSTAHNNTTILLDMAIYNDAYHTNSNNTDMCISRETEMTNFIEKCIFFFSFYSGFLLEQFLELDVGITF
jgi:hypothetical protein